MLAVRFFEYGGPEVLSVDEVDEPHAKPGTVRVRARAASVNPMDSKVRSGSMRDAMRIKLPHIPGFDAAGVVDEVGEGVTDVAVGDEVFGLGKACYAERVVLDVWAPKPAQWSWEEAAGAGTAAETAVRALNGLELGEAMTLLIDGAAGGVGSVAVQMAVARGARVIGTASEPRHAMLRTWGASPTTYGSGLVARVAELAPDGVDAVFDVVGKTPIETLIAIAGQADRVLTIANFDAGSSGVQLTTRRAPTARQALEEAAAFGALGQLRIPIEGSFSFSEAAAAHALSQTGHVSGKVVLTAP
jgi:NADPH:quinone reductase-like Zn-dependent oxidoreductase